MIFTDTHIGPVHILFHPMDVNVDTVTAQSNFPAPDVPSEHSDRSTTSQFVTTPLCAQTSVSTIPAMPNADTPPSFPIPKFESSTLSISTTRENLARYGVTLAMRELCFDDDEGDDDERIEFQQKEALLYLDIARAQGNVQKLEQKLAQAKWDETNTIAKLYKIQAEEAERRSDAAEARVGTIRNSIHMTGGTLCDTSIQKHHRISEDSIQLGTVNEVLKSSAIPLYFCPWDSGDPDMGLLCISREIGREMWEGLREGKTPGMSESIVGAKGKAMTWTDRQCGKGLL
ncbi:hypothetical protein EV363DRAFT_1423709 [Boletus edulis]|nr:hypothetical protein EV363DRAFT_1423709 [Boletus edulis]